MKVIIQVEDGDDMHHAQFIANTIQGMREAKRIGQNLEVKVSRSTVATSDAKPVGK